MPAKKPPHNPWPSEAAKLHTQAAIDVLSRKLAELKAEQSGTQSADGQSQADDGSCRDYQTDHEPS